MSQLHPSQVHTYLQMHSRAKAASWLCWATSVLVLCAAVDVQQKQIRPWLFLGLQLPCGVEEISKNQLNN